MCFHHARIEEETDGESVWYNLIICYSTVQHTSGYCGPFHTRGEAIIWADRHGYSVDQDWQSDDNDD